jgi:hypothetical protein
LLHPDKKAGNLAIANRSPGDKEGDMRKKKIILALLASVVALLVVTGATTKSPGVEQLPPYIGVIKNNTKYDLSVPSENSLATLIVPGRNWIEFVVWDPKFDFIAYHEGEPFACQKIVVNPDAYPYMCKNYDFIVEINPRVPERPRYYKKYKKMYRKRRAG